MSNRVSLYLQDAHDLRDGLDYVRYAEEKGFEVVWQAESRLVRDAVVPMAAYAAVTERIKVGSGVINNWTRNIGLLAATYLTLDDLALPYAMHLCEHLKHSPKQSTARSSRFIQACMDFNQGRINETQLIDITTKEGFKYVLDAFHVVNTKAVQERFYDVIDEEFFIDERKFNKGIRLTDNLFKLFYVFDHSAENLNQETESRN